MAKTVNPPHASESSADPRLGADLPAPPSHVLLVDDDESLRETIAELLEVTGFHPITAADAVEALAVLRQEQRVDALITDLTMAGTDGMALIRQAREIKPNLPAILLTGYTEPRTFGVMADSSNFHILRKPVQSNHLIKILESLISKTTYR